jgi:hypothetical protein
MMLDAMVFSSFVNMMMPPPLIVVSPMGAPIGTMADVDAIGDPDVIDSHADAGGDTGDLDGDLGDQGDGELASAWDDDFGGGDFDGGDY